MTHQAHNIPWTLLSSNLSWRLSNPCKTDATDLHLRFRPDQGKKLTYFANAFARTIREHGDCERKKNPSYEPPDLDEVVVPDHVAKKIATTVRRWRDQSPRLHKVRDGRQACPEMLGLCSHENEECLCALPYKTRKMKAFLGEFRPNDCYKFWEQNGEAFFNVEVFETLLLYGEMDVLFKICSNRGSDLKTWWQRQECYCNPWSLGWKSISHLALDVYLLLNTIYHFPEIWDASPLGQKDYRRMRSYQRLVYRVTGQAWTGPAMYPHRQFFGIKDNQFGRAWRSNSKQWSHLTKRFGKQASPMGHIPYEEFLLHEETVGYEASPSDVSHVRWILCEKGLPIEIANLILGTASYSGKRRLPVPHDPFHPGNQNELAKHLKYCWQLIVRTEAIGRALGMEIDWETEISLSVIRHFDCSCCSQETPRLYKRDYNESDEGFGGFC